MTRQQALEWITDVIGTLDDNNSDESFRNELADAWIELFDEFETRGGILIWPSEEDEYYLNFQSPDHMVDNAVCIGLGHERPEELAVTLKRAIDAALIGAMSQKWIDKQKGDSK